MRRRSFAYGWVLAAVLVAVFTGGGVAGAEVRLEGQFQQGGLVHGHTEPGTTVTLNGRHVRLTAAGDFIFGFGWDAPAEAMLEVVLTDGTREQRTLRVAKRKYAVQRIDGLPKKMVTPPPEVLARIQAENARIAQARAADAPRPLYATGFIWPVTGPVTGVFGSQRILNGEPRQPHFGVDVAAPEGTPVRAPADAVVTIADPDMYYTGGTVVLDHGHGLTSVYSHLKDILVKEGDELRQGDPIGGVGRTGRATGVHLDWRVNWFDQRLDPALLVPPMPAE
jgi:murein DD-endopeptidase MepM/ murein hydrolase activator NlpD